MIQEDDQPMESVRMRTIRAIDDRGWYPVAMGLTVIMLVLVLFNISDMGVLEDSWPGDVIAVISGISAAAMIGGWWEQSSRMLGIGFLLAGFVEVTRSVFLFLHDPHVIGVWLGFGVAIIAIGSYIKEGHSRQRKRLDDAGT
jgi:hypothetical protein